MSRVIDISAWRLNGYASVSIDAVASFRPLVAPQSGHPAQAPIATRARGPSNAPSASPRFPEPSLLDPRLRELWTIWPFANSGNRLFAPGLLQIPLGGRGWVDFHLRARAPCASSIHINEGDLDFGFHYSIFVSVHSDGHVATIDLPFLSGFEHNGEATDTTPAGNIALGGLPTLSLQEMPPAVAGFDWIQRPSCTVVMLSGAIVGASRSSTSGSTAIGIQTNLSPVLSMNVQATTPTSGITYNPTSFIYRLPILLDPVRPGRRS